MPNEKAACSGCGVVYPRQQLTEFDGQLLCPECLRETTVICERCGDRIWENEAVGDGRITLCQCCYERHYVSCIDCGRFLHENDAYYLSENKVFNVFSVSPRAAKSVKKM